MYIFIYLIYLAIYSSIYLSILSIYLFYLYIYLFINLSIYSIYISNVKSQVFLFLNDMWPKNGPNFFFGGNPSEGSCLLLLGFLGEEHSLDVGEYTTLGNGDTGEEFVQFFVIADGELEMSGDDSGFLVVTGSIASEFKNLSS